MGCSEPLPARNLAELPHVRGKPSQRLIGRRTGLDVSAHNCVGALVMEQYDQAFRVAGSPTVSTRPASRPRTAALDVSCMEQYRDGTIPSSACAGGCSAFVGSMFT